MFAQRKSRPSTIWCVSNLALEDRYSIDTSAMIDWWVRYYPPTAFAGLVPRMDQLVAEGRIRASREVRDELGRVNDACFEWAKNQLDFFHDSDAAIQAVVTELMRQYFNPSKPDKGIGGADPLVIALAAIQQPRPWVVVTGEKPGSAENPRYLGSAEISDRNRFVRSAFWT